MIIDDRFKLRAWVHNVHHKLIVDKTKKNSKGFYDSHYEGLWTMAEVQCVYFQKNRIRARYYKDAKLTDPVVRDYGKYDFDFELMQCTGYKDINGVLIYEKDILKCEDGQLIQILWDKEEKILFASEAADIGDCFDIWDIAHERSPVIVGNTYQTPELIKEA